MFYLKETLASRWVSTTQKGNATEAAILNALIARDIGVLMPFGGAQPYDLVADLGDGHFLRVQCKTARSVRGGCVTFNGHRTDHGRGRRSYAGLADAFGVYFPPEESIYVVPVSEVTCQVVTLRREPTKNNQQHGIRFAADYEIDRWSIDSLRVLASRPSIPGDVVST